MTSEQVNQARLSADGETYEKTELQKLAEKFGITIENQERMAKEEQERRQEINQLRGNADNIVKLLPEDLKKLADLINKQNAEHNNTN